MTLLYSYSLSNLVQEIPMYLVFYIDFIVFIYLHT